MHHFQDISGQKQGNYTGIIKKRTDKGSGDKWGGKKARRDDKRISHTDGDQNAWNSLMEVASLRRN